MTPQPCLSQVVAVLRELRFVCYASFNRRKKIVSFRAESKRLRNAFAKPISAQFITDSKQSTFVANFKEPFKAHKWLASLFFIQFVACLASLETSVASIVWC